MIHIVTLYNLLGFHCIGPIPDWLDVMDDRPAKEQLHEAYAHGGGWMPMDGWVFKPETLEAQYNPDAEDADPPYKALASMQFRDELILFYEHSWVGIVQKDGSFEISRMD